MKIREATKKDFKTIAELTEKNHSYIVRVDTWKMMKVGPGYKDLAFDNYFNDVESHNGLWLVAEDERNIIGCGLATLSEPSRLIKEKYKDEYFLTGFIKNVFVEEIYRGQGIGTKIIKELENYLRKKGATTARIEVFSPNTNAVKVYKRIGYEDHSRIMIKKL